MKGEDTTNTEYPSHTQGLPLALCTHILVSDPCRKALLVAPSSVPRRRETEAQELGEQRACQSREQGWAPRLPKHLADCSLWSRDPIPIKAGGARTEMCLRVTD